MMAVNGAILILIAAVTFGLISDRSAPVSESAIKFPTPAAITQPIDSLKTLLDANLFGVERSESPSSPPLHAPPTKLNLKLSGVVMSESPNLARAIISSQNGRDHSYQLNDTVPGNARITQIYADRVILEHNGTWESLQLSLPIGGQSPISTGFNKRLSFDQNALADAIPAEAVTLNSGQSGWRLSPSKYSRVFKKMGLKPGDLITKVNTVSAGEGASRTELLNELTTADQLHLKVLRQKAPLSFYFIMKN